MPFLRIWQLTGTCSPPSTAATVISATEPQVLKRLFPDEFQFLASDDVSSPRIEIDFPERLNESVVQDIDMVLESLTLIDELARDAIAAGLRRDGSAAIKLFRAWAGAGPGRAVAAAEFLSELQPTQLLILPDGGRSNRDRVVVTYSLADSAMPGTITVRFLDPTGPELDPVQWTGIG
jgi:hypothetical protein